VLIRLLRCTLVGLGLAFFVAVLCLTALWIYIEFFWARAHRGLGVVAGGMYPLMWLLPAAFLAGFIWEWSRSRKK
jgi:hypothetical protein